jgi:hypothetical protein
MISIPPNLIAEDFVKYGLVGKNAQTLSPKVGQFGFK